MYLLQVICLTGHTLGAVFGRNRWHGEGATQDDIEALCLPLPHHGVDQLVLLRIQSPDLTSGLLASVEKLGVQLGEKTVAETNKVPEFENIKYQFEIS